MTKPSKSSSEAGLQHGKASWQHQPNSPEEDARIRVLNEQWEQSESVPLLLFRRAIQEHINLKMLEVIKDKWRRLAVEEANHSKRAPVAKQTSLRKDETKNTISLQFDPNTARDASGRQLTKQEWMCANFERYIKAIKECEESGSSAALEAELTADRRASGGVHGNRQ